MKTNRAIPSVLALAIAVAFLIPVAIEAASTVTFDNQSGKPALVKLVGPTASPVSVEKGMKESASIAPGHYFIKIRYGTPGAYSYSKGDEFDVTETATTASDITITLHKVVAGNYGSRAISEMEFGKDAPKDVMQQNTKLPEETQKALIETGSNPANANRAVAVGTDVLFLSFVADNDTQMAGQIVQMTEQIIDVLDRKSFSLTLDRTYVERELRTTGNETARTYLTACLAEGTLSPKGVPINITPWSEWSKKSISVAEQHAGKPKLEVHFAADRSTKYLSGINVVEFKVPKLTFSLMQGDTRKWRAEWTGSPPAKSSFPPTAFNEQLRDFLQQRIFTFMVP